MLSLKCPKMGDMASESSLLSSREVAIYTLCTVMKQLKLYRKVLLKPFDSVIQPACYEL